MTMAQLTVLALVTVAAFLDIRSHRIPNWLTYPSWGIGLVLGAVESGQTGVTSSIAGFLVTFVPMFLMFMGGSIGGGDVKLMGGVGALLGFSGGLNALISSIIIGGFFAAIILLWQGRLFPILKHAASKTWGAINPAHVPFEAPPQPKDAFPFGVAIALATYLTVISDQVGAPTPAGVFG